MNFSTAAVLESNDARHKAIAAGLKKAGLRVTAAREVEALKRETVVVLGSSAASPSRLARQVRARLPGVLVLAAQARGFKAPYADAVLPLPVSANDLKVRLAERKRGSGKAAAKTTAASRAGDGILDPATNFYTFAHFKEVIFVEVKRARRYGFPLALAVVGFDPIDGMEGPEVHTQLLGGLALAIRRSLRDTDYPVQYSNDRILLLMPHTDLAGSLIVARRICERVANATLPVGDRIIHPTISVGVAAGDVGRDYGFSDLIRQGQDGLTVAQANGGNRVEFVTALDSSGPLPDIGIPSIPPVGSAPMP